MDRILFYHLNFLFSREEVEEFFHSRDRDFDGYLSFEEFLGEESQLEKLFKRMDKNNDGKVSKQVLTPKCTMYIQSCNFSFKEFSSLCKNLTEEQARYYMSLCKRKDVLVL